MKTIQKNIKHIQKLCENHKVARLYAFGSVLTNKFNSESDIDLLVDFKKIKKENYADNYFDLKYAMEDLLKKRVDMLENKAIKNPFIRESIEENKVIVYG